MRLMIWMCERGRLILGIVWNGTDPALRLMFSGWGAVGYWLSYICLMLEIVVLTWNRILLPFSLTNEIFTEKQQASDRSQPASC